MTDRQVVAEYLYHSADGELLYIVKRYEPKGFAQFRPDGRPGLDGIERVPYNLPEVLKASEVWIVEGEKDADTLNGIGDYVATTFPGGAKWKPEYTKWFVGRKVNVVPDNDKTGGAVAQKIVEALRAAEVVTDVYSCAPFKDVTEMYEATDKIEMVLEEPCPPLPLLGGWNLVWGTGQSNGVIPAPSILRFKDGVDLLYKSKINGLFGPSEVGKTWVAMQAVREVLDDGGSVAYYDFEDDRPSIEGRLKSMGVDDEALKRFGYQSPSRPLKRGEELPVAPVDLAVFDGATELSAIFNKGTDSATDLAFIENTVLKPWADAGAAVVLIHHAPHEGDRPLGTQHFKSMISGAAYMCKLGADARTTIYIYKDRNRGVRKHFPKWARSIGRLVVEESSVIPDGKKVFFEAW